MIKSITFLEYKKRKWGAVPEDSAYHSEGKNTIYLAVADGVSRDPFNIYPDLNTEKGKKLMCDNYQRPSIAKRAADIAVRSRDLFKANLDIEKLNKKSVPDPNWIKEDLAGCTASLAKIIGNKLQYQFIGCCGIGVIDSSGKVKFKTPDEYWTTDDSRWNLVRKAEFVKGFIASVGKDHKWWNYPEGRILMRRFFRNKPKQRYSFGVLTGEKDAEHYIRKGNFNLSRGDFVMAYSDGLRKILFSQEGLKAIRKRDLLTLERLCEKNVDSEGTLVYWFSN